MLLMFTPVVVYVASSASNSSQTQQLAHVYAYYNEHTTMHTTTILHVQLNERTNLPAITHTKAAAITQSVTSTFAATIDDDGVHSLHGLTF